LTEVEKTFFELKETLTKIQNLFRFSAALSRESDASFDKLVPRHKIHSR